MQYSTPRSKSRHSAADKTHSARRSRRPYKKFWTARPKECNFVRIMTSAPNPLHLANTAQQMARNAPKDDAVVFNKVAMICMGVMAVGSVMQVLQPLLRDLMRKHDRETPNSGRGR